MKGRQTDRQRGGQKQTLCQKGILSNCVTEPAQFRLQPECSMRVTSNTSRPRLSVSLNFTSPLRPVFLCHFLSFRGRSTQSAVIPLPCEQRLIMIYSTADCSQEHPAAFFFFFFFLKTFFLVCSVYQPSGTAQAWE